MLFASAKRVAFWGILALSFASESGAHAAGPALLLRAEVQSNPAKIVLRWNPPPAGSEGKSISIWRKPIDGQTWGAPGYTGQPKSYVKTIKGNPTTWTDPDPKITSGSLYEYRVHQSYSGGRSMGLICAGIEVPLVHYRGKIILVVDESHSSRLANELRGLEGDLVGDGWTVIRMDFERGVSLNRRRYAGQVRRLRDGIRNVYRSDPENVKAVLLIGHLPVPYSGSKAYDWHSPQNDAKHRNLWHVGAWPTDNYYGDMDWEWPDSKVRETRSDFARNHNVPGDGKFDVNSCDAGSAGYPKTGSYPVCEIMVGRVDLYDMPAFRKSERELLRQYLHKNHAYRHKQRTYAQRGLIDYNLNESKRGLNENNGPRRSFAVLFGAENVRSNPQVDWFPELGRQDYLWAAGAGYAGFTNLQGIGSTRDFARKPSRVVFTALYGSFFGDWDSRDNLLRAGLANQDTLSCVWLGPQINANFGLGVHSMGIGKTLGYAIDASHYKGRLNHEGAMNMRTGLLRGVHVSLMGDPTLRLHVVAPPVDLKVSRTGAGSLAALNWRPSADANDPDFRGYHVYGASRRSGSFQLLSQAGPIRINSYQTAPGAGPSFMVRAVKLQRTLSGSYYNASQGVFAE